MKTRPRRAPRRPLTILEVMALFRQFDGPSWAHWRVFLKGLFALPMADDELGTYRLGTGRQRLPRQAAREAWLVKGRRAGGSLIAALVAVYCAAFKTYHLVAGEMGLVMLLAADRAQARVLKKYVSALLHAVPTLAALIVRENAWSIELSNGITIEIQASSFRSVRGYTVVAAICDEIAFWPTADAADPDTEILNALRPAMSTIDNALLFCLSSAYAQRGELYRAYDMYLGHDDEQDEAGVFLWQGATVLMNPSVPQSVVDAAYARDAAVASAEFGALFRTDLERLLSPDRLQSVIVPGRQQLAPRSGVLYRAFVDPAGGSTGKGADSFTIAIGHSEADAAVIDVLLEARPPYSPAAVVSQFVTILKAYGISAVVGDRYAGEWPSEAFRGRGIEYLISEKSKSELYGELVPLIHSQRVQLPDHPRLIQQLTGLERRVGRSGKDSIDHGPGGHDDLANVVAGVVALTASLGLPGLPEMLMCNREASGLPVSLCYLWANEGQYQAYTPSGDPSCGTCPAHSHVLTLWRADSKGLGLREFRWRECGSNQFLDRKRSQIIETRFQAWADAMCI